MMAKESHATKCTVFCIIVKAPLSDINQTLQISTISTNTTARDVCDNSFNSCAKDKFEVIFDTDGKVKTTHDAKLNFNIYLSIDLLISSSTTFSGIYTREGWI